MSIRSLISGVIATWALAGGLVLLVIVLATAVNAAGFTADMIAGLWGGDVPGLSGYEDGVTMLIGVAALAMFPYCQLHGGHAAVDIFMDKAPDWARRGVEILSGLLVTALALTMAVMLIYGTIETRRRQCRNRRAGLACVGFHADRRPVVPALGHCGADGNLRTGGVLCRVN